MIQGQNEPLVVMFSEEDDLTLVQNLYALLYYDNEVELKRWDFESAEIEAENNLIKFPLLEEETLNFKDGVAYLEIKLLDDEERILFADVFKLRIEKRVDKRRLINA